MTVNNTRQSHACGRWRVTCLPADGGRLTSLCYNGYELLTGKPKHFHAPCNDYGMYETRPVYGYDDCFPSLDPCPFPGMNWKIPDHGELCWLPWQVLSDNNTFSCRTESKRLPIIFYRTLRFGPRELSWNFSLVNKGLSAWPFLHVMHSLMPLDRIAGIQVPAFKSARDEITGKTMALHKPAEISNLLKNSPRGTALMILLRNIRQGRCVVSLRNGPRIAITFPAKLFPTLGIWWNNNAYPDEKGCRRTECAIEPIPGISGNLAKAHCQGMYLKVAAGKRVSWQIKWRVI